jgi:histidine triad (HIT) family protein
MSDCIFCKIARGEIPAKKVYEDELVLAFHDIAPQREVHILLIPKSHITSLATVTATDEVILGRLMAKAGEIAAANGSPDGFRLIVNTGTIGMQEVPHLHAHIVGGSIPVGPMLKKQH